MIFNTDTTILPKDIIIITMQFCPPTNNALPMTPPPLVRTHRIMFLNQTYEEFRQDAINYYNIHGVDQYSYFAPHGNDAGRYIIFTDGTEFAENYPGIQNLPLQGPLNYETREFIATRKVRKIQSLWRRKLWIRSVYLVIIQNTPLSENILSIIFYFV
ncbi:uncharacterized protein METZ01_LOCUS86966 [marine metagenome]|uniref:Uncharacterized protein n=1 Tax=marine metagenome TaxID=408172 RepID=A0A381V158_9ZZZZ